MSLGCKNSSSTGFEAIHLGKPWKPRSQDFSPSTCQMCDLGRGNYPPRVQDPQAGLKITSRDCVCATGFSEQLLCSKIRAVISAGGHL